MFYAIAIFKLGFYFFWPLVILGLIAGAFAREARRRESTPAEDDAAQRRQAFLDFCAVMERNPVPESRRGMLFDQYWRAGYANALCALRGLRPHALPVDWQAAQACRNLDPAVMARQDAADKAAARKAAEYAAYRAARDFEDEHARQVRANARAAARALARTVLAAQQPAAPARPRSRP